MLMQARVAIKVHYLDITCEIEFLEGTHRSDTDAKTAGVVLCPGVGFDVTPTDRIALMLNATLPEAYELTLGFESDHPTMSAGAAETLVEAVGKCGKIGRGGRIVDLPIGRVMVSGSGRASSMKSSLRAQDGEIDTFEARSHYDTFDRRIWSRVDEGQNRRHS
jgi:short subunit dehydrogenase-like uncharacterized protein